MVHGKAVHYEEVTAVKMDEKNLEFVVEHTRKRSSRSERLRRQHLRMHTRGPSSACGGTRCARRWPRPPVPLPPEVISLNEGKRASSQSPPRNTDARDQPPVRLHAV